MFRDSFKYYKSKNPPPDLSSVLNLYNDDIDNTKIKRRVLQSKTFFGMKDSQSWEVYDVLDNPGLIYIKNPFTKLGQRYWTVRCLRDYTRKPNKLNIDAHNLVLDGNQWWDYAQANKEVREKLRWATLGYHHDWDSKIYSESSKSTVPTDLRQLCTFVSRTLGFNNFNAEAVIVNFYHLDSQLSGHTDHSEENLEIPLLSFSFGSPAIFLIGGTSLDIKPTAMLLQSGDIVVMSKESRLCYHGVPKILQSTTRFWEGSDELSDGNGDQQGFDDEVIKNCCVDEFWAPFGQYLRVSRINVNARHVLNIGQTHLSRIKS